MTAGWIYRLMVARLGCFFLLIASILLGVFVLSLITGVNSLEMLAYGLAFLLLGLILAVRGRQKPEPNESRFRMVRRKRSKQSSDK